MISPEQNADCSCQGGVCDRRLLQTFPVPQIPQNHARLFPFSNSSN